MRLAVLALLATVAASGQGVRYERVPDERLRARLEAVKKKNAERQEEVRRQLEEAGCGRLGLEKVKGTKLENVVCVLQGRTPVTVVVGAHHDKSASSEMGVADNWSGVSLLASLYESLAKEPRELTYVFVGFAAEEEGLKGAASFVKDWEKAAKPKIAAMVNVDSVGMAGTKLWPGRSDERLVGLMEQLANAQQLDLGLVDVGAVADSDSGPFVARKIPVVDVHSVTRETIGVLHSGEDKPGVVKFEHYRDAYRLVAGFLALLDSMQRRAIETH